MACPHLFMSWEDGVRFACDYYVHLYPLKSEQSRNRLVGIKVSFFPVFQWSMKITAVSLKLGETRVFISPMKRGKGSDEREKKGQQPKAKVVGKVYKTLKNDRL